MFEGRIERVNNWLTLECKSNCLENGREDRSRAIFSLPPASAARKLSRTTSRFISPCRDSLSAVRRPLSLFSSLPPILHPSHSSPPSLIGRRRFHPGRRKILDEGNLRCSFSNSKFHDFRVGLIWKIGSKLEGREKGREGMEVVINQPLEPVKI